MSATEYERTKFDVMMQDEFGFKEGQYGYDDVGQGWFDLLRRLIRALDAEGWDRELHQVKEKFGGLRFYPGALTSRMSQLIDEAEDASFLICELCGAPGEEHSRGGWLMVRCKPCLSSSP